MTGLFKLAQNTTAVAALLIDRAITIECTVWEGYTPKALRSIADKITRETIALRGDVTVRVKFKYSPEYVKPQYTIPLGATA